MNTTVCEHLLVVDLEATCDEHGRLPKSEMEIIEIGAVIVLREGFQPVSEFQAFVRPVRHPQLTEFCRKLTSIDQESVDSANTFPVVVTEFKRWLYSFQKVVSSSWGDYDQRQFAQDSQFHGIPYPLPGGHLNLKVMFSAAQGLKKKLGMAEALKHAGIPLEGTHHRGIDDARNIAKLLPYCFGE